MVLNRSTTITITIITGITGIPHMVLNRSSDSPGGQTPRMLQLHPIHGVRIDCIYIIRLEGVHIQLGEWGYESVHPVIPIGLFVTYDLLSQADHFVFLVHGSPLSDLVHPTGHTDLRLESEVEVAMRLVGRFTAILSRRG